MNNVKAIAVKAFNAELANKFHQASQRKLSIEQFVHDFLVSFVSEETKRAYINDMGYFFKFIRSGGVALNEPSDIQSFHFQIYRDHLIAQGYASATINRRLVAIRSFVKWCVSTNLMKYNPLDCIKLPKVQTESSTVAFDDDEVLKMLNAADRTTHKGRVHRLAMVLLFNLGLRRNELVGIKLQDFEEDRGHTILKIHGKGDKVRRMPINPVVMSEINDYLTSLGELGIKLLGADFLLQTEICKKNQTQMDGATIYRVVKRYAERVGINKDVSPHSCRATAISHLLDTRYVPIREVATFAGHANITTTERYDKRRGNLDKSAAYMIDYSNVSSTPYAPRG